MSEPNDDFLPRTFHKMTDVPDESLSGCRGHVPLLRIGPLRLSAGLAAVLALFFGLALAAVLAALCWYSSLPAQTIALVALTFGCFGALLFTVSLVLALCRARPRFSVRSLALVNGLSALSFACLPWQLATALTVGLGLILVFMPMSIVEAFTILATTFVVGALLMPSVTPDHGRRRVRPAAPAPVLPPTPVPALPPAMPPAN